MGDLSNFEREQIVGARLAGASVIKTATLLGVLKATVSNMLRNGGRKSTLRERDHSTLR
jgi:IS30 family transposase